MHKVILYGYCQYKCGGIASHIKRLNRYLKENVEDITHAYFHFDECASPLCRLELSPLKLFFLLWNREFQLLQVYAFCNWRIMLCAFFASKLFGIKVISTIENDRFKDSYFDLRIWEKAIARLFYSQVDRLIAVNDQTELLFVPRDKIRIIPRFIPPSAEELASEEIPRRIKEFIDKHPLCIISNASCLRRYKGQDLYGLDMAVDLMISLRKGFCKGVGMIFVIANVSRDMSSYLVEIKNLVSQERLKDDFPYLGGADCFPCGSENM